MSRERKQRGILATPTGKERLQKAKADGRELGKALTYERIAAKARVDKKTVERFLKRLQPVDRDSACAICQALELEITDIVAPDEWNDDQSPQPSKPPVTPSAVIKTRLPRVEKWQGRQTEIDLLKLELSKENVSLIGIIAAGGYGKSALTVKLREQLVSDWQASVLWVSFIQPYSLAQFGRWLLETLGQPYEEKWDETTLIEQMIDGLISKRYFLILDNLETVITAEDKEDSFYRQFLSQWLEEGYNSKILLTSREQPKFAVNLRERCYWLSLKGLEEVDAIRLVRENHGLTGTDEEVAQFVNKMGRHPLLMNLVCNLMKDKFYAGVSVTESENLGLEFLLRETVRHRNTETCVREVVEASLQRLSKKLDEALKRFSVLREEFDLDLAQGLVTEITEDELRYLARLSLLQEIPPEPAKPRRFQFLPLIQTIVQQQADTEILRSAHQSALDYFLAHLPAPPWESLEDVTPYLEGFYHAGELEDWQLAYDILNEERGGEQGKDKSVNRFLDFQGFYRDGAKLYGQIIAGSQREELCYRKSLHSLGIFYFYLGQYQKAINAHQQHHDISEEIGNWKGVALSLGSLGDCYDHLGLYEEAIIFDKKSLKINKKIGYKLGVAESLGRIGNRYLSLARYEKAIDYLQQCHNIGKEIGSLETIATSLGNLGVCYGKLARNETALIYLHQSIEIEKEIGNRGGLAGSLCNLGGRYYSLGQYKEAIAYYQRSFEIAKEIGVPHMIASVSGNIGNCYFCLGQIEKAMFYCQQYHDISKEIGYQKGVAHSLNNLGRCYESLEEYEKAMSYYQKSLDFNKKIGNLQRLGECLVNMAKCLNNIAETLTKLENYSEVESYIQDSLVICYNYGLQEVVAHILKDLAKIAHKTNRSELALSRCQEALELSQELGITLVKECEELLAEIQDTLEED